MVFPAHPCLHTIFTCHLKITNLEALQVNAGKTHVQGPLGIGLKHIWETSHKITAAVEVCETDVLWEVSRRGWSSSLLSEKHHTEVYLVSWGTLSILLVSIWQKLICIITLPREGFLLGILAWIAPRCDGGTIAMNRQVLNLCGFVEGAALLPSNARGSLPVEVFFSTSTCSTASGISDEAIFAFRQIESGSSCLQW